LFAFFGVFFLAEGEEGFSEEFGVLFSLLA
jgi:hypothetical protein